MKKPRSFFKEKYIFATDAALNECLEQIKLPVLLYTCVPIFELPATTSIMALSRTTCFIRVVDPDGVDPDSDPKLQSCAGDETRIPVFHSRFGSRIMARLGYSEKPKTN